MDSLDNDACQNKNMDIVEEMKSGNYEHLVSTFDKYFGEYVILER